MVDRFTALCLMRDAGSYVVIAATLTAEFGIHVTKNACIGKARRLGVTNGNGHDRHAASRRKKPKPKPRKKPNERPGRKPVTSERAAPTPPPPSVSLPGQLSLFQLGPRDCHWPYGDGPFTFCGAATHQTGGPYCSEHHRVAFPGLYRR